MASGLCHVDSAAPRARQGTSRAWWVFFAGAAVFCFLAVGATWLIIDLRARAISDTEATLAALSLSIADQADRSFQALEQVQIGLMDEMRAGGIRTEAAYIALMSGRAVHQALRERVLGLPQVNAVTLIDRDGNLINFSRYWPIPKVNIADRDYFKALTADPALDKFISAPVRNRGDGTWTIYLAKPFRAPDGSFLGLVLGAVELTYYEGLYRRILPESDAVISMFRADGVRLVRMPPSNPSIGRVLEHAAVTDVVRTHSPVQSLHTISPIDGAERLASVRAVPHYPIAILVSRTVSAVLADWREQSAYLAGATGLLELGLFGTGLMFARHVRGQRMVQQFEAAKNQADAARAAAEADATLARTQEHGERALRTQYARFALALDNMKQGLGMFDARGRVIVANRQIGDMFGGGTVEPGMALVVLLRAARRPGGLSLGDSCNAWRLLSKLRHERESASRLWAIDDGRSFSIGFEPMGEGGWLLTCEDISERRQAEARIAYLAQHDQLTDLPNRVLFRESLARAIAAASDEGSCAVHYIDLDRFKGVNDTLGHSAGDALLQLAAMRIRRCLRDDDIVARLGGDEFAVIQHGLRTPLGAASLAKRLCDEFELPFEIDGQQVMVGSSIGIAVTTDASTDIEQMLKQADLALYQAKSDGRGRYRFFEPEMDRIVSERRRLELDLRQALSAKQFEVHYQPQLRVKGRRLTGFEALLRWRHPERGLIPPSAFIATAEELGLIVPIGAWVLEQACRDACAWPDDLTVAVNLSPIQVLSPSLVETVVAALKSSGLAAKRLELEITESVMLHDTGDTLEKLHELRDLGISIAMDDFGTGYSSLSYLRRFPFDKVKIDRSFVEGLDSNPDCLSIVRAIVGLCRGLQMVALAEGVETEFQMAELEEEACAEVQGFLFGAAMPGDEIPRWINSNRAADVAMLSTAG